MNQMDKEIKRPNSCTGDTGLQMIHAYTRADDIYMHFTHVHEQINPDLYVKVSLITPPELSEKVQFGLRAGKLNRSY
jgi:hypothetical protein